ncbi:MAG TPA: hypothetical protein PLD25_29425 [Chloroflexota bacterium]|nr:hypothetical protein [Chloroflexota bacterium]HUM67379.1 hypothetical protein [Chloroflexota bacterium]
MNSKGYAKFESAWIRYLVRHPLTAVGMHWTFQSLFYMDRTERRFKLVLDVALTLLFWLLFQLWLPWFAAILPAFFVAHTLNFLLNGHLWGALKHYGYVENSYDEFSSYAAHLADRVKANHSIVYAAIYGSCVREEWCSTSDLDVRIIRNKGFGNGLKACWYCTTERSRALLFGFPLDMYLLDDTKGLDYLRLDESPTVLLDRNQEAW